MDWNQYLNDKVQPIINDVLQELLKTHPDDPIPIILQVLQQKTKEGLYPFFIKIFTRSKNSA